MTEIPDYLDEIIQGETGWQKIPTHEWKCPFNPGFFIVYKDEADSVIYKIEDSIIISFEITDNGVLEMSLNLDCHKASEEEIKEYDTSI